MIRMSDLRWRTRVLLVSSLVTLAAVLAGWVIFTLCAARLVTSTYRGDSWAVLNNLIRDRAHTPLEYYFESGRVQFSRQVMLAVCVQAIVVATLLWRQTRQTVTDFFTARSSPINLAILYVPVNPSAVTLTAVMLRACRPSACPVYAREVDLPGDVAPAPISIFARLVREAAASVRPHHAGEFARRRPTHLTNRHQNRHRRSRRRRAASCDRIQPRAGTGEVRVSPAGFEPTLSA